MNDAQRQVLETIYRLEEQHLRRNQFEFWLAPGDITAALDGMSEADVRERLRELWVMRKVMQLPDDGAPDELRNVELDDLDAHGTERLLPLEPNDVRGNDQPHQQVAIFPLRADLRYRSRVAEIARMLSYNYQRFNMAPATGLLRYERRPQRRPRYTLLLTAFAGELAAGISAGRVTLQFQGGFPEGFPLDATINRPRLINAIEAVMGALASSLSSPGRPAMLADFQALSIAATLAGLYSSEYRQRYDGHVVTAGVGSGKSYAFQVGALIHAAYMALDGNQRLQVLLMYPRVVLAANQFRDLQILVEDASNRLGGGVQLLAPPLDAGGQLRAQMGIDDQQGGGTLEAIRRAYQGRYQILISNLDTLANRIVHPEASAGLTTGMDLVVFDEVHLLSGIYGGHGRMLLKRLELMRAIRQLWRQHPGAHFEQLVAALPQVRAPYFVAASATVAQPAHHTARILSRQPNRILHIGPGETEETGFVHHVFLRQRPETSSTTAAINATACLIHNRRDGTFREYYQRVDGQPIGLHELANPIQPAATTELRRTESIHKTLGFCDSLDSVGRWADLVADNERTKFANMPDGPNPAQTALPYFVRFQEPLWRVVHHLSFRAQPEVWQDRLRVHYGSLCRDCKKGVRRRIPRIPPGLTQAQIDRVEVLWSAQDDQERTYLAQLGVKPDLFHASWLRPLRDAAGAPEIGNLDECPFSRCGLCWWWSIDHLGSNRPTPPTQQEPLNGHKQPSASPERRYHAVNAVRVRTFTSNYDFDATAIASINDIFRENGARVFRGQAFRTTQENALLVIGSPKLEVGIDMDRVSDGITFRSMRDPASFQQKIGRVGRERLSDSLLVHVVTGSLREQYYYRNPRIALDPDYLQPIPLHEKNAIVARNHYFMAIVDWLCLQADAPPADRIPGRGDRVNLVNDQPFGQFGAWAAKIQGIFAFLFGNHPRQAQNLENLRSYLVRLGATDEELLHPAAVNNPLHPGMALPTEQMGAIDVFRHEFGPGLLLTPITINNRPTTLAEMCQYPRYVVNQQLPGLPRHERFIREYYESDNRVKDRSYLWQILGLKLFRRGIPQQNLRGNQPWVWISTLFEAVGNESVRVFEQRDTRQREQRVETAALAISLLCPGTYTYRYYNDTGPLKVPVASGGAAGLVPIVPLVEAVRLNINDGDYFEPAGCPPLTPDDLPEDFQTAAGNVEVHRPRQVCLIPARSTPRPVLRGLIGDGDEAPFPVPPDPVFNELPTPPKSYPLRWYRVESAHPQGLHCRFQERFEPEPGHGPLQPLPLPPVAGLFADIIFDPSLAVTDFVWGLDRSFTAREPVPARLVYRDADDPTARAVAIGHHYRAPGLAFRVDLRDDSPVGDFLQQVFQRSHSPVHQSLLWQILHAFLSEHARNPTAPDAPPWERGSRPSIFAVQNLTKIVLFHLLSRWHPDPAANAPPANAFRPTLDDVRGCFEAGHPNYIDDNRYLVLCDILARHQNPFDVQARADSIATNLVNFQTACASAAELNDDFFLQITRRILLNSLGLSLHAASLRLTGAENNDLSYFYAERDTDGFVYLFDTDQYGNGTSDLIRDNFYISPIERTLVARQAAMGQSPDPLPTVDFLTCFEESLQECDNSQGAHLAFHSAPANHEPFVRLQGAVQAERQTAGRVFDFVRVAMGLDSYDELIPFQVCPEFLAHLTDPTAAYAIYAGQQLVGSDEFPTFQSLESAMGVCISGCIECLVSPEQNVRGPLLATVSVNKLLLDAVYRTLVCEAGTPAANIAYPANGPGRTVVWDQLAIEVATATGAQINGRPPIHVHLPGLAAAPGASVTIIPAAAPGPWNRVLRTGWNPAPAPAPLVRPRMSL